MPSGCSFSFSSPGLKMLILLLFPADKIINLSLSLPTHTIQNIFSVAFCRIFVFKCKFLVNFVVSVLIRDHAGCPRGSLCHSPFLHLYSILSSGCTWLMMNNLRCVCFIPHTSNPTPSAGTAHSRPAANFLISTLRLAHLKFASN